MERKSLSIKNKISSTRFILVYLFFQILLIAHPLNLTKMDFNLSNKILHLRFVSFNLEKIFNKNYEDMSQILGDKNKIYLLTKQHLYIKDCKLLPLKLNVKNEIVIDEYFKVICKQYNDLDFYFDLFFNFDKTQQGVLKISNDKNSSVYVFTPSKTFHKINILSNTLSFNDFIKMGIMHILTGFDHLTFLLMLILPVITFFNSIKKAIIQIIEIATMFTISHSVTLSLSAFNIITPPERLIESLIAFTIFFTALNNIYHWISYKKEWLLAFLFGFIHGFGFANALKEIHLNINNFAEVVFGFNIGVEIGQIIVITFTFPVIYFLVKKWFKIYYFLVAYGLIVSLLWMIDRIFNLNFMPF